jgi:excisionase family DNA binding protein
MECEPGKTRRRPPATTLAELAARPTCSIDEAARLLGIGRSTAFAAAHDGSLPTLRLSKRLLVPTAKLLAMLGVEQGE